MNERELAKELAKNATFNAELSDNNSNKHHLNSIIIDKEEFKNIDFDLLKQELNKLNYTFDDFYPFPKTSDSKIFIYHI